MQAVSFLLLLGGLHGVFLAFVLLSKGRGRVAANNFLAAILLIFSGYLFESTLLLEGRIAQFPHIQAVFVPLFFLIGPLYYAYVRSMLGEMVHLPHRNLLHLIPACICFLTILPFYLEPAAYKVALSQGVDPDTFRMSANRASYYGVLLVHVAIYTLATWRFLQKNPPIADRRGKAKVAKIERWLTYSTVGLAVFLVSFLVVYLLFVFSDFYLYYARLALLLMAALLIHAVGYGTVKESVIVPEVGAVWADKRYQGSALTEETAERLKQALIRLMDEEKAYRANDLSLGGISKRLSANSQYVSQLINQEFACSFTDFVNGYRISEAKELLKDSQFDHWNLLGIALEVGFNNTNTFSRVFKRHTGQTPSAFRKALASSLA